MNSQWRRLGKPVQSDRLVQIIDSAWGEIAAAWQWSQLLSWVLATGWGLRHTKKKLCGCVEESFLFLNLSKRNFLALSSMCYRDYRQVFWHWVLSLGDNSMKCIAHVISPRWKQFWWDFSLLTCSIDQVSPQAKFQCGTFWPVRQKSKLSFWFSPVK